MHKNQDKNFAPEKQRKWKKRTRNRPKRANLGAIQVLEGKTAVKTSCQRVRQDSARWGINLEKLDRVRVSIGAKNPQTMRFSQGLGTRILAGAEGLEPSARGFGDRCSTN